MAVVFAILCVIVTITFLLYQYLTSNFDFWKIRGVKGPKPILFFGTIKDVILLRKSLSNYMIELFNEYKEEPFIGIFFRNTPVLVLKDPQVIKDVLIKDFSYFPQRGMHIFEKAEPLSQNLILLEAKIWRPLRKKLTPLFSAGKLKEMFPLMLKCADRFEEYLHKFQENDIFESRALMARYTVDVISSCVFGINTDTFSDKESKFYEMGREFFRPNLKKVIKQQIKEIFPRLYNNLGTLFSDGGVTKFFTEAFTQTMDYKKKYNIHRNDVLNILVELRDNPEKLGEKIELTDSFLVAQAFILFIAGFETSSMTISNALYELAQRQDLQNRLRKEIRDEYKKNGGTLTFESIKTMPYLHAVFQETIRKHPSGVIILRQSLAPYTFQGTKVTIPKHQDIIVPIIAIHRDSTIFPNPDIFDPERFTDDTKYDEGCYLPFGRGPRNCIGERFAVHQTKVGLIAFLRNHKVDICEKTEIPYTIEPASMVLASQKGIYLKISKAN